LCIICIFVIALSNVIGGNNATPTATFTVQNIATIVAGTAEMAITQTAMAITPTLAVTSTDLPTLTQPVIPTPITIPSAINSPIPTNTVIFILPTNTVIFVLPTNPPPGGSVCSCSGDTLNCTDFSSQGSAQACFNYCVQQGAGDIHRLDQDNDGLACENN
jgi:hypothetical protein